MMESVLEQHPNVQWAIEGGGKHHKMVLSKGNRKRFVPFSVTNTDYRGMRNKISDLKRALRELEG